MLAMCSAAINRFEWLKAVTQAEGLRPASKVMATALAVQFADDKTGQLNPKVPTLADYVKTSIDTAKRAIKALVDAGWLVRTEGRGRGNHTSYTLCSPVKIISFSTQKKGGSTAPLTKEKGAALRGKGGTTAPFHYKDKQSYEQKARATGGDVSPIYNLSIRMVYDHDTETIAEWNRWLADNGLPSLQSLPIRTSDKGGTGYQMPLRFVPSSENDQRKVRQYIRWKSDQREVSYAAQ